jgi:hypothetical protein
MSVSLSVSVKETSYSIANNTSTVSITVKVTTSGASYNQEGTAKLYVELNGSSKATAKRVTFGKNRTTTLFSKSYTINHNADGTKSVPWNVRLITGISAGTLRKSGSLKLTNIPRTSSISLSSASLNLGSALTVNISRASSAFTHTLQYSFNNSTFYSFATKVTTSYKWSLPYSLANNIASTNKSVTLYIRCVTYNGSTQVGTATKSLTINIPNNSSTQPNISSIVTSEGLASSPFTIFVQNYSKLKIHINASAKYNAVISSCKTVVGNTTYTHTVTNGVISDVTTNVITQSGDITLTTTIIDSRGFSYTKTATVNIVAYSVPVLSALTVTQSNNSLNVKINGGISGLGGQNKVTLKIKYKKVLDANYQTITVYNNTSNYTFINVPSSPISYTGLLADDPVVVQVTLNDLIYNTEALAITKEFVTNLNFVIGKTPYEFVGIPTNGDLYTCSYIPTNGMISQNIFRQRSWQLQSGVTTASKIKEICYDEIINKLVGYTSDNKIVVGNTTSDWEEVSINENLIGIYQVFNKAVLLGDTHIYWINNDYVYGEALLSDCVESKDLPITTSPWIYIFGNTLCLFIMNIQGDVYYLEYADENWKREPIDYSLELSENNPYKPLRDYAPIANAKFFNGGGWIYMIYEGADGWKMLTAPVHAYR